jgi:hypothetical protein
MVRDLLDDLARDVPNYADADRALTAARAARRRRAGGVAAALTAVAVIAAGVAWWPRLAPPDATPPDRRVSSPVPSRPLLPDGAVGPAQLLYRPRCEQVCFDVVVRLADGAEYSLLRGDFNVPSLSPDGRLLVAAFEFGSYRFRDLTSADPPRRVQGDPLGPGMWQPAGWSPDSRWLLMWGPRGNEVYEFARIDMADRSVVKYQPPTGDYVVGVLPSGELLVSPSMWRAPLSLRVVDPVTRTERPVPMAGATAALEDGETLRNDPTMPAAVSPDGTHVTISVVNGQRVTGMVEIELATGIVRTRYAFPADRRWEPVAYTTGGITLVSRGRPLAVGVLDPVTLRITEPAQVPDPMALLVRGGATWY